MEKEQAECPVFGDCDDKTLSSGDKNMKKENGGVFTALPTEKALITDRVGSRQGPSSRKLKNAFELFPQEIWEMMLDEMDDSRDIMSVLHGMPQLDIAVRSSHKRFWYIGEILTSLHGFIEEKDVLNLRLVCKDWQRRVDHFLPNQPFFRAYSETLHKDCPDFWMFNQDSISKNEDGLIEVSSYSKTFREFGPFISTYNDNSDDDDIEEEPSLNMDEALEHPRSRNPFVFRKLDLNIYDISSTDDEVNQLEKMLSFLKQFGFHLWHLHITLRLPENMMEITNLIKILEFTPNLKSPFLQVFGEIKENAQCNNATVLKESLPELPFLECLDLSECTALEPSAHEVSQGLIMRYGAQIRRLELGLNYWKPKFKDMFPQLTELELHQSVSHPHISDISTFQNLLLTLSAPNLVMIKFVSYPSKDLSFSFQGDIFKWLKRFPRIKYFQIKSEISIEKFDDKLLLDADLIKDCIPSLQTLKIVDGHGLSYDFLRCFPALRHLEMQCFCWPTVVDFAIPDSSIKLKEQLQTAKLYESNIWEFLPKLRTIPLENSKPWKYNSFIFNRDTYEKLKKFGKIPLEPQLHAYRKEIQDFMDRNTNLYQTSEPEPLERIPINY